MGRTICGVALLWALGCGSGDSFEGGSCISAGTPGRCADGRTALCRVPECNGEGWIDYGTTGVLCRRADDGGGSPYCGRESDEMCWTNEEILALCGLD